MGGKGSGRQTKVEELANAGKILSGAAIASARYLSDVINRKITPSWARVDVAKYILDHELGKPRQKVQLAGEGGQPLTWQAIVLLAAQGEELPGMPGIERPLIPEVSKTAEELRETVIVARENAVEVPPGPRETHQETAESGPEVS